MVDKLLSSYPERSITYLLGHDSGNLVGKIAISDLPSGGGGGGGTPGGLAGSIQFNDASSLGGFGYWDGSSTLSLGNTTTSQALKVFNTYAGTLAAPTSATWFEAKWVGGVLNLTTAGSGGASTAATMHISTGNRSGYWDMEISAAYIALVAGLGGTSTYYAAVDAFTPSANGTLDLGRTATRFKTVYAGNYIGANFSSVAQGLTPLSGGGTTNFLRADGTWALPGGVAIIADIAPSTVTTPSGSLWFEGDTGFFYVLYDSGTPAWVQIDNTGLPVPYTVGDLLYASNTTTLAKLSAGTAGHVLTSGGAGVAPAWAAGGGGGGTPGGSAGQVQWNNTTFAGITNLTTNGTNITALRLASTASLDWDNAGTADVKLVRHGAGVLALRDGSNEQSFRVYQNYTDASNGLWLESLWSGGTMYLRVIGNGSGAGSAAMTVGPTGVAQLSLQGAPIFFATTSGISYYLTHIDFMCNSADMTSALGRAGKRWNVLYLGSMLVSELPTAAANMEGARATVTNALTPAFLSAVAAGGSVVTPVFCNGTAWIVG